MAPHDNHLSLDGKMRQYKNTNALVCSLSYHISIYIFFFFFFFSHIRPHLKTQQNTLSPHTTFTKILHKLFLIYTNHPSYSLTTSSNNKTPTPTFFIFDYTQPNPTIFTKHSPNIIIHHLFPSFNHFLLLFSTENHLQNTRIHSFLFLITTFFFIKKRHYLKNTLQEA